MKYIPQQVFLNKFFKIYITFYRIFFLEQTFQNQLFSFSFSLQVLSIFFFFANILSLFFFSYSDYGQRQWWCGKRKYFSCFLLIIGCS